MTLTPELAKAIVEEIPGAKPVLSTRGDSKGQHVKYNFRFEFVGPSIRHIAITRRATSEGVTVYINQQSINNITFSNSIVRSVRVSEKYPKGYKGPTGDKGLSSSAAQLSSLNPEKNDVLRLSVLAEGSFRQLLSWYLDQDLTKTVQPKKSAPEKADAALTNQSPTVISSVVSVSPSEQAEFESDTKNLATDEREAVVKVRYGQGNFRDVLIGVAGEKCWMSGLEGKRLLVASHIKPWSHCNEDTTSRGQPDNGLLLSALWDSAFDAGLITFDECWNVVSSSELSESAKTVLNIKEFSNLPEIFRNDRRGRYLAYHRTKVFEYWKKIP